MRNVDFLNVEIVIILTKLYKNSKNYFLAVAIQRFLITSCITGFVYLFHERLKEKRLVKFISQRWFLTSYRKKKFKATSFVIDRM